MLPCLCRRTRSAKATAQLTERFQEAQQRVHQLDRQLAAALEEAQAARERINGLEGQVQVRAVYGSQCLLAPAASGGVDCHTWRACRAVFDWVHCPGIAGFQDPGDPGEGGARGGPGCRR